MGKDSLKVNKTIESITKCLENLDLEVSSENGDVKRVKEYVMKTFLIADARIEILDVEDITNGITKVRF